MTRNQRGKLYIQDNGTESATSRNKPVQHCKRSNLSLEPNSSNLENFDITIDILGIHLLQPSKHYFFVRSLNVENFHCDVCEFVKYRQISFFISNEI